MAAGVAVVLLVGAVALVWRRATAPARYPVDLLVSYGDNAEMGEVWPAGTGKHLALWTGRDSVYRVPDGWLVDDGTYLLRPDGTRTRLLPGPELAGGVAASDGRGLAWRTDTALWVGRLVDGHLVHRRHIPVPRSSGLWPDLYSGHAVHLSDEYGPDATWVPSVGFWKDREANPAVRSVVDVTADRRYFVGVVASHGHRCLAMLDPTRRLRTVAKRCLPGDAVPVSGGVSPHGRNIAVRSGDTIRLYRWATVFGSGRAIATYPGHPHDPYVDDLYWITDRSFAIEVGNHTGGRTVGWIYRLGDDHAHTIRLPARTVLTSLREEGSTEVDGYFVARYGV